MAFKMKGHTLPGIKQKESPAKLFGVDDVIAAAIITAATSAASAGVQGGVSNAKAKKKQKMEAVGKSSEAIAGMKAPGSKTRII